jgi:hypothetical protein
MDDADEHEEFEPLVVIEAWDRVSIGLLRRIVSGEAPDGTMYGESLQMGRQAALDVALARSLGTRPLLDASTGEVVPPRRAAVRRPAAR